MNNPSIIRADFNEIIFDGRNQEYGAFAIRKNYDRTVLGSFLIASSVIIGLLLLLKFFQEKPANTESDLAKTVVLTEVDLNHQLPPVEPEEEVAALPPAETESEPAPPVEQEKGMDTQEYLNPNPTKDAPDHTTIADDTLLKDKQAGLTTTDSLGNGRVGGSPFGKSDTVVTKKPPVVRPPAGNKIDEPDPFKPHVGEMPVVKNMKDISRKIGYPADAKASQLEGKVQYRVLVDEKGNYMKHAVLQSSHPIFDKACRKQLKNLKFKPGKMGDQPVKVWVVIPFRFSLNR